MPVRLKDHGLFTDLERRTALRDLSDRAVIWYFAVGAIRTYSNQQDLADLLRRSRLWLREDHQNPVQDLQVSVRAKPDSAVPRRVVDRLGEDVVREMIEARRAGMKLRDVAERYGISESSVKRIST